MINKSKKKILLASMAFFVSVTAASAQELTLDELKEKINKVNPDAEYAYIIGKYAFTNGWTVETQDVMLASKSTGDVDPTDRDSMSIYRVDFDIAEDGTKSNSHIGTNAVGSGELKLDNTNKIDINYIDYRGINADSLVDVDELVSTAVGTINKEIFDATFENDTISVKIVGNNVNFVNGMGSKILDALKTIASNEKIESVDFTYNGITFNYNKNTDLDTILSWLKENSDAIFGKSYTEVTASDLLDKKFNATVHLASTNLSTNYNPSETYDFEFVTEKISTDELVKKALDTQTLFDSSEVEIKDNNVTVTVSDPDEEIVEGKGTKILEAFQNIIDNEDVTSVKFSIDGEEFVYPNESKGIIDWLKEVSQKLFNKEPSKLKMSDLLGKEVSATINLADSVTNTSDTDTYTVNFINIIEEEELKSVGDEALSEINDQNKVKVEVNEGTITVTVGDLNSRIATDAQGAGIKTAIIDFLNDDKIDSITFNVTGLDGVSATDSTVTIDKNTTEESILDVAGVFAKALGKDSTNVTYNDIKNLAVGVSVRLADGLEIKNEDGTITDKIEYSLKIADETLANK